MGETREAGRALDALVAERVMGWTDFVLPSATCAPEFDVTATPPEWSAIRYQRVPDYSTNIASAWRVLDRLRSQGYGVILSDVRAGFWTCEIDRDTWRGSEVWTAETLPLAICRAALAAVSREAPRYVTMGLTDETWTPLCRVKPDSLCQNETAEQDAAPPTCATCLRRDPRFAPTKETRHAE